MRYGLVVLALALGIGCSNAQKAKIGAWGEKHKITLYSGGKKVGEWTCTGRIENEEGSDGFFFLDDKTGKLVRICGTAVIERM